MKTKTIGSLLVGALTAWAPANSFAQEQAAEAPAPQQQADDPAAISSPPTPPPMAEPPPPDEAPAPAPAEQAETQWVYPYPTGQWVYMVGNGWGWVPAGATTMAVEGVPYSYLYTPLNGWTWYVSPWGWGPYAFGAWVRHPWLPVGWRAGWVAGPRVAGRLAFFRPAYAIYGAHASNGGYSRAAGRGGGRR